MTLTQLADHTVSVAGIAGAAFVAQADSVETFWPTSAIGRINTLLALAALVTVFWRGWRFSQAPVEKRFGAVDTRVDGIEERLELCEASQQQIAEVTAATHELREAIQQLKEMFRDVNRLIRQHGEDVAHIRGTMEAWDGRERRRRDRRGSDDE